MDHFYIYSVRHTFLLPQMEFDFQNKVRRKHRIKWRKIRKNIKLWRIKEIKKRKEIKRIKEIKRRKEINKQLLLI